MSNVFMCTFNARLRYCEPTKQIMMGVFNTQSLGRIQWLLQISHDDSTVDYYANAVSCVHPFNGECWRYVLFC